MTEACPYCGGLLKGDEAFPPMPPRKQRIYRAMLGAGADGIGSEDLLVRMYAEDEYPTPGGPSVLRVLICEMNKVLKKYNQRIVSVYQKHYRLVSLKEVKDEEEVQQNANP